MRPLKLLLIVLVLSNCERGHAQEPKVLISRQSNFHCAKRSREYCEKKIKFYTRVDSAYDCIVSDFSEEKNDAFTLICPKCDWRMQQGPIVKSFPPNHPQKPGSHGTLSPFQTASLRFSSSNSKKARSYAVTYSVLQNNSVVWDYVDSTKSARYVVLDTAIDFRVASTEGLNYFMLQGDSGLPEPTLVDEVKKCIHISPSQFASDESFAGGWTEIAILRTKKDQSDLRSAGISVYFPTSDEKSTLRKLTVELRKGVGDSAYYPVLAEFLKSRYPNTSFVGLANLNQDFQ
jgi:hypothetical protein